jgi:RimJ/RimL family protein N-acetyltransferase
MVYEIEKKQYNKVKRLFSLLAEDHMCVVVSLENNYPSRIFVDNIDSPTSGFIYLGKRTLGFCGREDNKEFNAIIKKILQKEFLPLLLDELKVSEVIIRYDENWEGVIPTFFDNLNENQLGNYVFKNLKHDYRKRKLPEGYQYVSINSEFLRKQHLKNFNYVDRWVKGCYLSIEDYLDRGFGFSITYKEEEIASTCMCNYISNDRKRCELGIITDVNHQRKGLAKNLVSRTLTHCIEQKIERVDWQTRLSNIGSVKTAEAVGFELNKLYTGHVIVNQDK